MTHEALTYILCAPIAVWVLYKFLRRSRPQAPQLDLFDELEDRRKRALRAANTRRIE